MVSPDPAHTRFLILRRPAPAFAFELAGGRLSVIPHSLLSFNRRSFSASPRFEASLRARVLPFLLLGLTLSTSPPPSANTLSSGPLFLLSSGVLHTGIAGQIVNELAACGGGGRVHGAKCLCMYVGSEEQSDWTPARDGWTTEVPRRPRQHPRVLPSCQPTSRTLRKRPHQPTNCFRARVREVRDQPTSPPPRPGGPLVFCPL